MAMGMFNSVKKESEHSVFSRVQVNSRLNNEGALNAARWSLPAWDAASPPSTYVILVDSQNPTTVTIYFLGTP